MKEDSQQNRTEDDFPEVVVSKHHRFSLVWVVPMIALVVSAWLIYDSYAKRGTEIEITFDSGSGLVSGKTELQYLGVQVGKVTNIQLDEKLSQVIVTAQLTKSASGLATQGAAFWVVRPEIGMAGVRGLDTILSGPYIGISPGDGKTPQHAFTGLPQQPATGPNESGLNLVLQAEQLASVKVDDPVYYREFQVGKVDQVSLASDAQTVHAHIHIEKDYQNLVRENTRFWNASGIGMDVGLFGAKIKTESLAAILAGGISFATPPNDQMGDRVSNGAVFKLYDEAEKDWLKWSPSISIPDTVAASMPEGNSADAEQEASQDPDNTTVEQPAGTGEVHTSPEHQSKLEGPPSHH